MVDGGMLCTGALIAPDHVLTAWHCVANMTGVPSTPKCDVDATPRPPALKASDLFVVDGADAFAAKEQLAVAEILSEEAPRFCGYDLAVLRLAKPISDRTWIAPRLDAAPTAGEPVTVIGYGHTKPLDDMTSGVRTLTTSTVESVGASARTAEEELLVTAGPCAGDSGGPLLDSEQRTIGVMSRGSQATCQHMIYERLDAHGPWLVELARASSTRLGIEPPAWAAPKTVDDAGTDAAPPAAAPPTEEKSGCAYGGASSGGLAWLAVAGALVAMRRRVSAR
jgi:V8-like Glu-specific endopeptidase